MAHWNIRIHHQEDFGDNNYRNPQQEKHLILYLMEYTKETV